MYYFLATIASALISIMIVINGQLTEASDPYAAAVIIHITGLLLITAVLLLKKEHPLKLQKIAPVLFSGGAIGVCTTFFNNATFGKISVSAILALGLLGQAVTSLTIDHFGLFRMPVRRFNLGKLAGFSCTLIGILFLLHGSEFAWFPVILSLLSGVTVVTSRSVNAELAELSSPLISTWYNYVVGLAGCLVLWIFAISSGASAFAAPRSTNPLIYTGGFIGVGMILILNLTVKRMPAFIMTLIMFIGQLFTGILLDSLLGTPLSVPQLIGGVLTALGLILNVLLDQRASSQAFPAD